MIPLTQPPLVSGFSSGALVQQSDIKLEAESSHEVRLAGFDFELLNPSSGSVLCVVDGNGFSVVVNATILNASSLACQLGYFLTGRTSISVLLEPLPASSNSSLVRPRYALFSQSVEFHLRPKVFSISPNYEFVGLGGSRTITVIGDGFVPTSVCSFGGRSTHTECVECWLFLCVTLPCLSCVYGSPRVVSLT